MGRAGFAILALPLVAVAAFLRDPSMFLAPRFWAEEGTHYFGSALQQGILDGLLNLTAAPHNPYLHALPQIATVVGAHALPLELAPYAAVAAWVLAIVALELAVIFSRAALLDPVPVRFLMALAPLLAVGSNENWASTLGAHFYCNVALVLLLLEAPRVAGHRRTAAIVGFGFLAFLSPTSWLVVPAAAGLCFSSWRTFRPYLALALAVLLLQVAIAFATFERAERSIADAAALPHLFLSKLMLGPIFGHHAVDAYGTWAKGLPPEFFQLTSVGAALIASASIALFWACSRKDATTNALLVTWVSAAGAYLALGLSVDRSQLAPSFVGGRCAYFPAMLLFALVAHQVMRPEPSGRRLRSIAFAALLLAMMLVGTLEFPYSGIPAFRMRGAPWREEVARFRENPEYNELRMAPPGWTVVVPGDTRPPS